MTGPRIPYPDATEYPEYFGQYIALVPEGDILEILASQIEDSCALLRSLSPDRGTHRYAPGKWSINQVIGHLADTERVFTYRALRFSRGDAQALPGFEQDDWVNAANFDDRTPGDLADEFAAVRAATLTLFRSMNEAMLTRQGIANAWTYPVHAVPFILAGHERHHLRFLRDRYL